MTVFYCFGESLNDTQVLAQLIYSRAEADNKSVKIHIMRAPLIQQKATSESTKRSNSEKVRAAVRARLKIRKEKGVVVVAHEDCDMVEPAHERIEKRIEDGLAGVGVPVIAAAPAFEMEAWWYLWPDAVAAVCSAWRRLGRSGTEVGKLNDAKKTLIRDLRPKGAIKARDYSEGDAPTIARKVRELKLIDSRSAVSASFLSFETKIKKKL